MPPWRLPPLVGTCRHTLDELIHGLVRVIVKVDGPIPFHVSGDGEQFPEGLEQLAHR